MGSLYRQFVCGCVCPNREPEEEDEPPVEGDDNLPFG